jgi:hypothetical protein
MLMHKYSLLAGVLDYCERTPLIHMRLFTLADNNIYEVVLPVQGLDVYT